MGFGALVGSIFGSSGGGISDALQDALFAATQEGIATSQQARRESRRLATMGREVFERDPRLAFAPDVQAVREGLARQTGGDLSPFALLSFEDADRLLTERAVQTGNLRSSNIQFGRSELLRRIVADELGRDFAFAQLFGGQDIAARTLGLNLLDLSRGFLGVAPQGVQSAAIAGSTAASAQQFNTALDIARGAAIGGVFDTLAEGFGNVATGEIPSLKTMGSNISNFLSFA